MYKLLVCPVYLAAMFYVEGSFSRLGPWLLVTMHATYGAAWCVKDIAFGDPAWRRPASVTSVAFLWFGLCCLYYPFGFFTIYVNSGAANELTPYFSSHEVVCEPHLAALAVWLWGWGMLLHFGSDCQKHYILHHCGRKGLITQVQCGPSPSMSSPSLFALN